MKKFLGFVFVLAGCAAAAFTYVASERARQTHRDWIADLTGQSGVRVLESEYEQGWLASRATTKLELRGSMGEGFKAGLEKAGQGDVRERIGIDFEHRIEHGLRPSWQWLQNGAEGSPIVAVVDTTASLDQETQNELVPIFGRIPPLSARTKVRQSGVAEVDVSMAAADFHPKPTEENPVAAWTARWKGLSGDFVVNGDRASFVGSLVAPGLTANVGALRFEVSGWRVSFDYARERELWVGETRQSVARLRLEDPSPSPSPLEDPSGIGEPLVRFGIEQLSSRQSTDVDGGSYESATELRFEKLVVAGQEWGGGHLDLDVRNVDVEALTALQKATDALGEDAAGTSDALVSESLEWLPQLIARGPVVDLASAGFGTPHGDVTLSGHVRIDEDAEPSLPLLLQGLEAMVQLEGPRILLDEFADADAERLNELREQGILIFMNDRFRVRLELAAGALRANGIPLDPTPFLQEAGPMISGAPDPDGAPFTPGIGFPAPGAMPEGFGAPTEGGAAPPGMPPASPPIE